MAGLAGVISAAQAKNVLQSLDHNEKERKELLADTQEQRMYDELQVAEPPRTEKQIGLCNGGVIHPSSKKAVYFQWIMLLCVLYNAIWIPMPAFFAPDMNGKVGITVCNSIIDVWFVIDLFLTFHIGYFDEWGALVTEKKKIRERYLKGYFWWDLAGCVPLELIGYAAGLSRTDRLSSFLRFTRCFRFHRLYTSEKLLSTHILFRLGRLLTGLILVAHWIGSLFFGLGIAQNEVNEWTGPPWTEVLGIEDADFITKYTNAMYFSVVTLLTVGYGDISPNTNTELIFAVIVIVLGAIFYAIMFGNVTLLIQNIERNHNQFRADQDELEKFMSFYQLPDDLQHKLRSSTELMWKLKKGIVMDDILRELPHSVKADTMMFLNQKILRSCSWFDCTDYNFIKHLCTQLQTVVYLRDEYVCRQGAMASSMFFVSRGHLEVTRNTGGTPKVVRFYHQYSYFGEIGLLLEKRRTASVRTLTNTELCILSRDDFDECLSMFPHFKAPVLKSAIRKAKKLRSLDTEGGEEPMCVCGNRSQLTVNDDNKLVYVCSSGICEFSQDVSSDGTTHAKKQKSSDAGSHDMMGGRQEVQKKMKKQTDLSTRMVISALMSRVSNLEAQREKLSKVDNSTPLNRVGGHGCSCSCACASQAGGQLGNTMVRMNLNRLVSLLQSKAMSPSGVPVASAASVPGVLPNSQSPQPFANTGDGAGSGHVDTVLYEYLKSPKRAGVAADHVNPFHN